MCSRAKKMKLMAVAVIEDSLTHTPMEMQQIAPIVQFGSSMFHLYTVLATLPFYREIHIRIPDFYERWIPRYLEQDFFMHFRMGRSTFERLLHDVGCIREAKYNQPHYGGRLPVVLEKALLITVWYLAKGGSFASISDRFNVTKSTMFVVTTNCIGYINQLSSKYICWPNEEDCREISQEFKQLSPYPDIIGAIDGCHIALKVPEEQQDSYLNRKFFHSINLQAICTSKRLFINTFAGFPGSAHDARVLRFSTIYKTVERHGAQKLFYGQYHLVGDSAYPCQTWLMTPYKDTGKLSNTQKKHNQALSRARVVIENSFASLKGRWRLLHYINVNSVERAVDIVNACVVLHNFCLINHDEFEIEDETIQMDDGGVGYTEDSDKSEGIKKRDRISQLF